jgi:hypothetical protein
MIFRLFGVAAIAAALLLPAVSTVDAAPPPPRVSVPVRVPPPPPRVAVPTAPRTNTGISVTNPNPVMNPIFWPIIFADHDEGSGDTRSSSVGGLIAIVAVVLVVVFIGAIVVMLL